MSKPILYGCDKSPYVRAVLLTANALSLDFEFKEVDFSKGKTKTEDFLKKNPQHTVPTLEDDGKYIWDSHAIITYLVSKYGKEDSLYPKDLFTRAVIDQRLHFDTAVLTQQLYKMVALFKQNIFEIPQDTKDGLLEVLEFLEKFLGDNSHLVGNSLTVADFSIIATLSTVELLSAIDTAKFPKLAAWQKRMTALPYYEKANGKTIKRIAQIGKFKKAAVKAAAAAKK